MKLNFLILKIISFLSVVFIVLTLTFLLLRLLPGGPFDKDKRLPPQIKQNIEKKYNLDKPLIEQYFKYVKDSLKGDFGMSYSYPDRSVKQIIIESAGISLKIGLLSILFTFISTILLSIYLFNNSSLISLLIKNSLYLFVGLPTFLIGAILIILFTVKFKFITFGLISKPVDYILPIITLSIPSISYLTNLLLESMDETKSKMFSRVARINKINKYNYIINYILRNSLIPLVTALGPITAFMITGSFVVESIFAIPGTGKAFILSVINRDYTVICGLTLFYTVVLLTINTLIDFLYPILDKRVKIDEY
ncbi:ABC transporter permease [bacterium]|nr:ABC transporter permease [bacterium]|tara:strand:- start:1364 stop:2287 length:924 start_codon:yes stop_codon:yes gene_type:complete